MSVSSPSPYQSFAKILSSYHEQYAEPGPSSVQLDSPMRSDAVLDEEGGLLVALMSAIEET
jgi:nuclear pore complex protein Nup107